MRLRTIARPTVPATAVLLAMLSLTGCGEDEQATEPGASAASTTEDPQDTDAGEQPLSFEEVSDDLVGRIGENVSVRATVADVVTPQVFTLTAEDQVNLEPIVVVDAEPVQDIEAGTPVVVTGKVRPEFSTADIGDLLHIQLDDEILGQWDGRPYLKAGDVDTESAAG